MKTVALISGGKDSCFNMMCCTAEGHNIVALANLRPEEADKQELDSYMYQTVGHTAIDLYAEAMGLPLYVQTITGSSLATDGDYRPQEGDEVEDLHKLLQAVKEDISIEAVSVGAILSDYQRVRVENVCGRLGLVVLSYLWRRDQTELLQEMIDCGVKANIIKVAALGLKPEKHLGLELSEILPHMLEMKNKYGLNVCGEGGEYETFVFDCPLFQQRISIDQTECVIHSDDAFAPVGYLILKKCNLHPKQAWDVNTPLQEQMLGLPLLTSSKWLEHQNLIELLDPVDPDMPSQADGGGGDSDLPTVLMCVPDVNLSGLEPPAFKIEGNAFQASGVRAIVGPDLDLSTATEQAMNNLKEQLTSHGILMKDIVSTSLSIGDMSNYKTINSVYNSFFDINPPVRVCVEANLPRNIVLQLDCQGHVKGKAGAEEGQESNNSRKVLHVQGLSHWAPANIGPYSQAVLDHDKLYMAGIVPLIPATLEPVQGGIGPQASLALTHIQSIMSVIAPGCTLNCCPLVTCYITRADYIDMARLQWKKALQEKEQVDSEKQSLTPCVQYVQVSALPKACLVEWHVLAWLRLEEADVREVMQVKHSENHSVQAIAQYCDGRPGLFSCHITVDVIDFEVFKRSEKTSLPKQMVDLFCHVWQECYGSGSDSAVPLVKVFFTPTMYDYNLLHKYFSKAVTVACLKYSVPSPILSLVPVSGLDSRKQVLAWCQ
ncbi:diphthine--ammonia ligase-like [Plakobranchus ocellatus]|uniref:Diphthine--ammonia ligase n=1 Tax=Plakobranchus ocellatus TaxID=259542 RepID=A0AAV3ZT62_9GAST|nr:diphthine--ammonia ligase-like [Plakobranchus ocellatus]